MLQTNETSLIGPPPATGIVLRSGKDPLASVKPNATDVFYVAASALMGVVFNGCGEHLTPGQHVCLRSLSQASSKYLSPVQQLRLTEEKVRAKSCDVQCAAIHAACCNMRLRCADANWRCHVLDCNTAEDIVQKRAGACCSSVSPMLSAISRYIPAPHHSHHVFKCMLTWLVMA